MQLTPKVSDLNHLNNLDNLNIRLIDLGCVSYSHGLKLQNEASELVKEDPSKVFIFFLEHSPVITFGKNADSSHLLVSQSELESRGIDLVRTDRGGQVTAHMPGQLVVYPIMHLSHLGLGVKKYVELLEQTVIDFLKEYLAIEAATDPVNPGVWVGKDKICALGVRISSRVSRHGLALNVNSGKELFEMMVPCGIRGRSTVSLADLTSKQLDFEELKRSFSQFLSGKWFGKECELQSFSGKLAGK